MEVTRDTHMFDVVVKLTSQIAHAHATHETQISLLRQCDPVRTRFFFPRVSRVLFAIDRIEARCTTKAPKFVSPPLPPKQHVARLVDDRCIFQFR